MKFLEKIKDDFENWLDQTYLYNFLAIYSVTDRGSCYDHIDTFDLENHLTWGVLQEYFDYNGIYIDIQTVFDDYKGGRAYGQTEFSWEIERQGFVNIESPNLHRTRPEAREAALEEAVNLLFLEEDM